MERKAHIFSLFFLGALALSHSIAQAAPPAAKPATGASRLPTAAAKPAEEETETETPLRAPNDDRTGKAVVCNGGKDDAASCVGQSDSFKRMAQAYSYLGHYMMTQSDYGTTLKGQVLADSQKAVLDCVNGANCTPAKEKMMLAALVQYNLGKSVKSMILQNNMNEEKMKSAPLPSNSRQISSKSASSGPTYTETFKLTGKDLSASGKFAPKDAAALNDMNKLGEEFKQDYLAFVDTYTNSKGSVPGTNSKKVGKERWNFEHEKLGGTESHHGWKIDPNTNTPVLDRNKQYMDEETQNRETVQAAVKNYKESLSAPRFVLPEDVEQKKQAADGKTNSTGASRKPGSAPAKTPDKVYVENSDGLKFRTLGLGMRGLADAKTGRPLNDGETAQVIANTINGQIDKLAEDKKKEKAAKGEKNMGPVNIQISMDNFDAYLDKIWPPSAPKTRYPSSQ